MSAFAVYFADFVIIESERMTALFRSDVGTLNRNSKIVKGNLTLSVQSPETTQ